MFKVPLDIEQELQKKYPNVHIPSFIQTLFNSIIEKTLTDGTCKMRDFGMFVSFVTTSPKGPVVRFKFRPSVSFSNKIRQDDYLLENLPVKAKVPFTEKHQDKCNSEIKQANIEAISIAQKIGHKKTKERVKTNAVFDLLEK